MAVYKGQYLKNKIIFWISFFLNKMAYMIAVLKFKLLMSHFSQS